MLRRALVAIPLFGALAALLGAALSVLPVVAALVAGGVGLLVQAAIAEVQERRLAKVTDRVLQLAHGDPTTRISGSGSPEWQRLVGGVNAVGDALGQRFAELAEERSRIERLLEQLPTAVLLFDDTGLVYANPAAEGLFALSGTIGRSPLQVLRMTDLADAVAEVHETGTPVELEVEWDGRQLAGRVSETTAGEVAMVVTDLTEARRVEAVRRDFVTNASHELKTPVAGIQALSDALPLAMERDEARARQMVGRLQTEAARLGQLVRDLLDLARLEDAAAQKGRRVDVSRVVLAQIDRMRALAQQREVRLECDCADEAAVVAVPEDVRLIVANLLDNAIQYSRPGGAVAVRVERRPGHVVLHVVDDGIGIAEGDRDRIFERFYRVDRARSRAAGGTGLGLAIVRHAVARHGGDVSVESVLGEGSTFRVVLPVEGDPAASA
jgi:signal transduction histidine kinase